MTWTKTKNRTAGGRVNVLIVSRKAATDNAAAPRNTLREGDDYPMISHHRVRIHQTIPVSLSQLHEPETQN